jgi:hypothetical protein
VRETAAEFQVLQDLLDRSDANAGAHLRMIMGGENRMSAEELVAKLDGIFEMHLATLTGSGAPVVAPIDAIFLHGKIFFGVPGTAVRSRLLRNDPRVSCSYTDGSFALIIHGTAVQMSDDSDEGQEYLEVCRELYVTLYGAGWSTWQQQRKREAEEAGLRDFAGWIEPRVMFAKR